MAMYYYACRLTAACSSPAPPIHKVAPPPFKQYKSVATISHQPGPSRPTDKVSLLPVSSHYHLHHHQHHTHQGQGNSTGGRSDHSTELVHEPLKSESLVYCDDSLVSGKLDALVEKMAPTADYYPDRAFIFAFLLASRLFIKPHDLLGQIFVKCQAELVSANKTVTDELCGSAESLAQQLTHIELERLSYIGAEEFLQTFVIQTQMIEPTYKDPRITTNYEVYAEWSTRLRRLVVTDIVRHNKSKKQRVRIVEYWVDTAKECFNIGNFNSLVAIIEGLNTAPISRLKRTWSKSEVTEQFTILDTQMSSTDNYASYRTLLRAAGARFNKDDRRWCIVIPIFTLLAEEIHDLCEQCLKKLPSGHINFENFWKLAKRMTEFITWKQVQCPFPKTAKVITYLQATPVLNDDGALLASFSCEPPQDDQEKELYEELMSKFSSQKSY